MRTALLAVVAALAIGSSARANDFGNPRPLEPNICTAASPRLFHTGLSNKPRPDCCPSATPCAGYLGSTASPARQHRLQG